MDNVPQSKYLLKMMLEDPEKGDDPERIRELKVQLKAAEERDEDLTFKMLREKDPYSRHFNDVPPFDEIIQKKSEKYFFMCSDVLPRIHYASPPLCSKDFNDYREGGLFNIPDDIEGRLRAYQHLFAEKVILSGKKGSIMFGVTWVRKDVYQIGTWGHSGDSAYFERMIKVSYWNPFLWPLRKIRNLFFRVLSYIINLQ